MIKVARRGTTFHGIPVCCVLPSGRARCSSLPLAHLSSEPFSTHNRAKRQHESGVSEKQTTRSSPRPLSVVSRHGQTCMISSRCFNSRLSSEVKARPAVGSPTSGQISVRRHGNLLPFSMHTHTHTAARPVRGSDVCVVSVVVPTLGTNLQVHRYMTATSLNAKGNSYLYPRLRSTSRVRNLGRPTNEIGVRTALVIRQPLTGGSSPIPASITVALLKGLQG